MPAVCDPWKELFVGGGRLALSTYEVAHVPRCSRAESRKGYSLSGLLSSSGPAVPQYCARMRAELSSESYT